MPHSFFYAPCVMHSIRQLIKLLISSAMATLTNDLMGKIVCDVPANGNIFLGVTVWDVYTNRNIFFGLTMWDVHVGECSNFKKIPTHTQDHGDA